MANIADYLKWRGDLEFSKDPFNDVDNLILSQLSYVNWKNVIPSINDNKKISLAQAAEDFFDLNDEEELRKDTSFIKDVPFFMRDAAKSLRYKDVMLSNYFQKADTDKEEQFAAFWAELPDKTVYIVFCGTDDTIIGWKEDFNMSFLNPVPSQQEAAAYVNMTAKKTLKKIRLGGHSKGGNLAIYSAVNAKPSIQKKIIEVYNNDGPGFDKKMVQSEPYVKMLPRIKTIVPEHSVVGMLLEHEESYMVVKSSQEGILQHDASTWQVNGNSFETVKHVSKESRMLNKALCRWINNISIEERKQFIDTFFSLITASGAETLTDFNANFFKNANLAIKTFTTLDSKTKSVMKKILRSLNSEYTHARKKAGGRLFLKKQRK